MKIVPMLFRIVCLVFVARRVCGGTVHVHHFTDKHIELNDAELVGDGSLLAKVNTQRTVLGCPRRALNGTILYGHGRGNAAGSYGPLPSAGTCKLAFCAVDGLSIALEWKNYENIPQPSTQAEKNELALRAFVRWRSRLINLGVDEIIVAWDPNDQGAFYDGSVASQWKSGDSRFRLGAPGDRRWAEADPMKAAVRDWCTHNHIPFVEAGADKGDGTTWPAKNGESLCAYLQKNGYDGHLVLWMFTHDCDGPVVATRAFVFCHDLGGAERCALWERDVVLAKEDISLHDLAFLQASSKMTSDGDRNWPSRNGEKSTACVLDCLWERRRRFLTPYQRTQQPDRTAWQDLVARVFEALRLVRTRALRRSPDDDADVPGTDVISLFRAEWRFRSTRGASRAEVAWTRPPGAVEETTAHGVADEILRVLVCDFKESTQTTAPTQDQIEEDPGPFLNEATEFFACCDFHILHMIQEP